MNRRQFLQTVTTGLLATPVLASASSKRLPTRVFGRSKLRVPILGFGSGSRFLMYQDEDQADEALNRALNLGICYIDTAHAYGNGRSEERIGRAMVTRRKEVVLATKIPGRTAEQARRQIELSLKRLKTDHLDVLHIHDLKSPRDLAAIEAKGGVLEALYEAREQEITRAIGITSHADPAALRDALERHDFDCTQMALNAGLAKMADSPAGMKATPLGSNSFEKLALPVATRKNLGVIAMKVFGQEQLLPAAPVDQLLSYALSLPVSLASVGMPKPEHIEHNAALAHAFRPLTTKQREHLIKSIEDSRKLAMARFFEDHQDA
ncbi:MAG TPA: aldo/keto reductase [Verrucomicrobiae bacterium]|nr:aldo/keto reductase [Verrucomicrobiae bacterium]